MTERGTLLRALIVTVAVAISGCGEQATIPATGTIYGDLLLEDGTPAAGVRVYAEEAGASAISDDEGRFIIDGLVAVDVDGIGKYYTVRGAGQENGTDIGFLVENVKVKGQQSYGLGEVTVPPTGAIAGKLQLDGASDHSGVRIEIAGISLDDVTRADGSFLIHRVPAHIGYRILCQMDGFADQFLDRIEVAGEQVPIGVEPGETVDLGVAMLEIE